MLKVIFVNSKVQNRQDQLAMIISGRFECLLYSLFDLLDNLPLSFRKLQDLHCLPIDSVNYLALQITQSRHCKWEAFSTKLCSRGLQCVFIGIEVPTVRKEFASKSSHDHNSIFVGLDSSISLPDWNVDSSRLWWVHTVNYFPLYVEIVERCIDIEFLNNVEVLFVLISNSTENIDKLAIEFTTWMIVTTMSQVGKLWPLILISIIDLHLFIGLWGILARTCNNNIPVLESSGWMTMSRVLHLCHEL